MNFDRRISRANRTISSAERIAGHCPDHTLDELVAIFDEFEMSVPRLREMRDHSVPCSMCGRPTHEPTALCERPGCIEVGIRQWRAQHPAKGGQR